MASFPIRCIYKISTIHNSKFYIGSTNNYVRRMKEHRSDLRNNRHPNTYLQRTFNKYGIENLKFEVLEELKFPENYNKSVIREHLICTELFYIKDIKPHYNTLLSDGSCFQHTHTTKKKIGSLSKGFPPGCREKGHATLRGRKVSIEQKIQGSKTRRGSNRNRMIDVYDLKGDVIGTFNFISEVAEFYGIKQSAIKNNLYGITKTCNNKTLKFRLV